MADWVHKCAFSPTPGFKVMTNSERNQIINVWEKNIPSSNKKFWVTSGKYKTNVIWSKDTATKVAVWVSPMKPKRGSKLKL